MLVDDAKRLISVMFGGDALDGNVEALNAALTAFGNKQKAGEHDVTVGLNAATKFRFTPDEPIEVGASVKVVGEKGILTYNGIEMAAFESGYVLVPETVADPITALSYSGIKEIEIGATLDLMSDLTITGSEGTLTFKAKTPTVATVDENGVVTALSGGMAYFEISCGSLRTMAAVSVKEAPHAHSFTEEFPLIKYLASEATCTEPAKYYRFCSCGIVGTETFSHGEAKGHNFGEWTLNLADNTCERTCSVCGDVEKDNSISLLSVSGKTAKAGDTVSVTISLANNPGIAALAFRVSYPKGAMKLESAVAGGLFGSATLNTSTGMFLFDNAADVTENGTLLTLTFKVSDMAALGEYRISVEIISCNNAAEERVVICGGQANIEVSDILSGDANGDGTVDTLDITRLRRYLAEESVDLFPGADMNGDGAVDIEDLTCLRRYLVEAGAGLGE
ncbi:repeat protein [Candidatus Apopatosoma intestinale]|nr:repeat protein [Candidatus Apopatosoma intestinale]